MRISFNELLSFIPIILLVTLITCILHDLVHHLYNHFLTRIFPYKIFKSISIALIDILSIVIISILFVLLLYYCNGGVFRFIFPFVMVLGYLIYKIILSKIILRILTLIFSPLERIVFNTV